MLTARAAQRAHRPPEGRPMSLSVFEAKSGAPRRAALAAALGRALPRWQGLIERVSAAHAPIEPVWHCAGPSFGWSLRLVRRGRVVLYLIPQAGGFLAAVVLGAKAEAAARAAGLPDGVLALIDAAPRYAEGRGVRVPVRTRADALAVERLVAFKLG
jgi:hypothetical protein